MSVSDYQKIKIAILEEIQADRTTSDVSKELGFTFDKYKRWLDNSKILKWDEFCDVCEKNGLNLPLALEKFCFPKDDLSEPKDFFAHLKQYNSFSTNQEIADYLNVHVSVVKRYNHGETIPDFETIFNLIDYQANYLASFLKQLFPGDITNPMIKKIIDEGTKGSFFSGNQTYFGLIEAAFGMEKYKTRTVDTATWLNDQLGIPKNEIQHYIAAMIDAGTIVKSGDDHYEATSGTTNLQHTFAEAIPYYQSLHQLAIDALEIKKKSPAPSPKPGILGHRIYATSTATAYKVKSILLQADADIKKTLLEDTGKSEELFCMLYQVFQVSK